MKVSVPRLQINKKILNEIDKQIDEESVRELSKALLQFELENWRIEYPRYTDFFEKQLTIYCRRKLQKQ